MNLKKSIAIALTATALFASFGCGDTGKQSVSNPAQSVTTQQNKPLDEATIKEIIKKLESSNIEERKALFWFDKLPADTFLKTPLKDGNTVFDLSQPLKHENLTVSNIKQEGDFAVVKASYIGADNQRHSEENCFRRFDGKWYIDLPVGIKSANHLRVSGYDEAALEAAANIGYTYEDEPIIVLDVRSKTTAVYQVGGWSQPSFVLITDKGEFPLQNTARCIMNLMEVGWINSAQPFRFMLPFKGAVGKPKAVRIIGFNELDNQNLPVDRDMKQVVTFTLSE